MAGDGNGSDEQHPAWCAPGHCFVTDPSRSTVADLRLPATELSSIDATASVDTVSWWCRLCDHEATVTSAPAADTAVIDPT